MRCFSRVENTSHRAEEGTAISETKVEDTVVEDTPAKQGEYSQLLYDLVKSAQRK